MTTPNAAAPSSSHLPPAARKQVKEANRLIAELHAPPQAVAAPPGADPANPEGLPSVTIATPPAAAAPAATQPAPPAADPSAAAPGEVPVATSPPAADPYEARYKSLKGKYDKTEREMAELRGRFGALEEMNRTLLEAASRPPTGAQPPAPMKPEEQFRALGITDKEITDYGPELLDVVARVARNLSAGELQALRNEVAQLKQNVGNVSKTVGQNAADRVYAELNAKVGPEWVAINSSDEFLAWLQEPDVFSGSRRLEGLQNAFQAADAARVVAIFKAYQGKTPTGSTSQPDPPAISRETLIAPGQGRGGAGEAPGATGGKIWSEQEISDFYQRARKGRISPADHATTEQEIVRAIAEGRVRASRPNHHSNSA